MWNSKLLYLEFRFNVVLMVVSFPLQVLFTQVRKVDGRCEQKRWSYRVDEEYFYPARQVYPTCDQKPSAPDGRSISKASMLYVQSNVCGSMLAKRIAGATLSL